MLSSLQFVSAPLGRLWLQLSKHPWRLSLATASLVAAGSLWFTMGANRPSANEPNPGADRATSVGLIRLSSAKLKAAQIHVAPAEMRSIQQVRTVPGYLNYDQSRQLLVTVPVGGIVKQVLVEPGQSVESGAPLAIISSPEIGAARDETIRRQADLQLAQREEERATQIASHVDELLTLLERRRPIEEIEKIVTDKVLGDHRDKVLGAYSRLLVAEATAANSASLQEGGVLSTRTLQERKSNRETAAALFQSTCEFAKFDVAQQHVKARAQAEQAERLLGVSRDRLTAFLGPDVQKMTAGATQGLNEFTLPAPRAGRIDQRNATAGLRFDAGQPLFTIADTSVLWLSAEIHERDWAQLAVQVGDEIHARIPALGEGRVSAKLRFIGAQVNSDSRAVPLVAELENVAGRLKPGMFAWIDVPTSRTRDALTVPPGAVLRHEGQPFVFVPANEGEFRRLDVEVGLETPEWSEIIRGLTTGMQVVDHNAFYLKSELLLEHEAE